MTIEKGVITGSFTISIISISGLIMSGVPVPPDPIEKRQMAVLKTLPTPGVGGHTCTQKTPEK